MADHVGAAVLAGTGSIRGVSRRVSGSVWRSISSAITPRYGAAGATVGSTFYLMGGWGGSGRLQENLAYDSVLNTWTTKASLPEPREWGSAVALGGYIYYVGGWSAAGQSDTLWRYDPVANGWTTLTPIPVASSGQAVADAVNNRILFSPPNNTTLRLYDVAGNSWSTATQPSFPGGFVATAHSNGKLYFHYNTFFWEYEPTTGTFTAKAASPLHNFPAIFSFDNRVWLVAGASSERDVHTYNAATNTWETRDDIVTPRVDTVGGVVDGRPIVVTGRRTSDYQSLSAVELYTAPEDSEASLPMDMTLWNSKLARASFSMSLSLAATDALIDPRRLNPGFLKVGYRPVGFVDPVRMTQLSSVVPLPPANASNVYVGSGDQTAGPVRLSEFAYASDGQYFYVASGYWGGVSWDQWWSNRLYRFDAGTETWTELASLPGFVGAEACKGGIIDGKFYVVMGNTGRSPGGKPFCSTCDFPDPEFDEADTWMLQSLWVYDIADNSWQRGPQPPFVDSYGTCTVLDGKLYLVQNYGVGWDESAGFAVYDPATETWTQLADQMFTAWDAPIAWSGDGKVWVHSYQHSSFGVEKNYITSYDPVAAVWTDETDNFTGATLWWMEGSTVIPISATTVRILGGHDEGAEPADAADRFSTDINFVTKTIIDSNIRVPGYGVRDADYGGGFYYNGVTYLMSESNFQPPTALWRTP